jgi:hypothetical protein
MNKLLWIFGIFTMLILVGAVSASTMTRTITPDFVNISENVTITLDYQNTGADFYLIDEQFPAGFTIVGNPDNGSTAQAGHLKWAVISGATSKNYTYVLQAPVEEGYHFFYGEWIEEGMNFSDIISGENSVLVDPWWNVSWIYRRNVTINGSFVLENLTNFAYPVFINGTYINYSNVNSDCSDIVFTDLNNTVLDYYNETCNITGETVFWVKYNLPAFQNTTIYLYYGNPNATSMQNETGTFSGQNIIGSWALRNANDRMFLNNGTVNGATAVEGQTDGAYYFRGSSPDYISFSEFTNATSGTLCAWFQPHQVSQYTPIISEGISGGQYPYIVFEVGNGGSYFGFDTKTESGGVPNAIRGNTTLNNSNWYHGCAVSNGTEWKLYLNGQEEAITILTTPPVNNGDWFGDAGGDIWSFGALRRGVSPVYSNVTLDEVKLYSDVKSAGWINALYSLGRNAQILGYEEVLRVCTTNYEKERIINITNTGNYQIPIHINSTVLDMSSILSNGADIEFCTTDGLERLTHWIYNDTWYPSGDNIIWVNLKGNSQIVMKYKNTSAVTSYSNAKETFPIGDNFNDNSLDTNLWSVMSGGGFTGTVNETGGYLILNGTGNTGVISLGQFNLSEALFETRFIFKQNDVRATEFANMINSPWSSGVSVKDAGAGGGLQLMYISGGWQNLQTLNASVMTNQSGTAELWRNGDTFRAKFNTTATQADSGWQNLSYAGINTVAFYKWVQTPSSDTLAMDWAFLAYTKDSLGYSIGGEITPPSPPAEYRLSSVLPYPWGYIAGIVLGAGMIMFIMLSLLGGEIADLLDPKNIAVIFVGLVIVAVFIAGIV